MSLAGDAAIDGAAEIDGVGHDQHVVVAHVAREAVDELVLHQPQRAEAVRLKHDQQPPGKCVQRRSVAVILSGLCAKSSITVTPLAVPTTSSRRLMPVKLASACAASLERHAAGARRGERRQRVGDIVLAGHAQPHAARLSRVSRSLHARTRCRPAPA